jgi:hypothetical protein
MSGATYRNTDVGLKEYVSNWFCKKYVLILTPYLLLRFNMRHLNTFGCSKFFVE